MHGLYVANEFPFNISFCAPLCWPDMFDPLSYPWPLQKFIGMPPSLKNASNFSVITTLFFR